MKVRSMKSSGLDSLVALAAFLKNRCFLLAVGTVARAGTTV